ncbi:MAG: hypothetical protein H0W83_02395 [Planctomycetes bacterium]|nr:hypothetical protein [Planctomycetota bacterium]
MVQINFGQREVSCKVVFYGPGMSGKTTNLEIIHKKAPKDAVGEMVSIATETDRTLYFDFLPLDLGQVAGMRTKFQLYTVPGQIYYNATRKLVLQGVDGVIFVADSSPEKMAENLESLQNLRDNLSEMGLQVDDVPIVLQYNKRDLPTAMSIEDMNAKMNPMRAPVFEGVAREGKGVFATLKEISRLVIEKLNKDHAPASTRRRTANNLETAKSPSGGVPVQHASGANKIPAMPSPSAQTPRPMPPAIGGGTSTTPLGQQRLPPRPPQQRTGPGAAPAAPAPGQRPSGPGVPQQRPTYTPTPASGSAVIAADADLSAKDKHLAKAKPPALDNRRGGANPDLGATDPNLRRYQDAQKSGGGAMKALVMLLLFLIIALVLLMILCLFVPAVRAQLPPNMQKMFMGESAPTTVTTPAPAPAMVPHTVAPAPASAPPVTVVAPATAPTSVPPENPVAKDPGATPDVPAVVPAVPAPEPAPKEPAPAAPIGGADGQ